MRDQFKFVWRCVKYAWSDCWTKATGAWAILGGVILAVVLYTLQDWLTAMNWVEAPTTIWGTAGYGAALTVGSVMAAFLVIFCGRLTLAPARLYWKQHRRADTLQIELLAERTHPNDGPNWSIREAFFHRVSDSARNVKMAGGRRATPRCSVSRSDHRLGAAVQNFSW